jgi:hypothetical protein
LSTKLKEANRDKSWRKLLGKPNLDKHQKDIEILLRLFALAGSSEKYEKPMKEYLNNTMKKHAAGTGKKAEVFFGVFPRVAALAASALGEKPFNLRGPLNASALDAVMCVLLEQPDALDAKMLRDRYATLKQNAQFRDLTLLATTDTKTVQARIKLAREVLLA